MKDKKKKHDLKKESAKPAVPGNPETLVSPTAKIGNSVMAFGLVSLVTGYFALYKGSDTLAPVLIVLGIITFGISLLLEPGWLPK